MISIKNLAIISFITAIAASIIVFRAYAQEDTSHNNLNNTEAAATDKPQDNSGEDIRGTPDLSKETQDDDRQDDTEDEASSEKDIPTEIETPSETLEKTDEDKHVPIELKKAYIEWEQVLEATAYTIELQDEKNKPIIKKTVEGTKLDVELPYGSYKYRIAIVNKFNKTFPPSRWYNLIVAPALLAEIESISPKKIKWKENTDTVIVKGKHFYPTTNVSLKNGSKVIPVDKYNYLNDSTISLELKSSKMYPSDYDIVIENPGEKITTERKGITIFNDEPFFNFTSNSRHVIGFESAYLSKPIGEMSAYSGSIGGTSFYEIHEFWRILPIFNFLKVTPTLYVGGRFGYHYFLFPQESFGKSDMIMGGAYIGYEFYLPIFIKYRFTLSPYIGYLQYMRWHSYNGQEYSSVRPVFIAGLTPMLQFSSSFAVGLQVEFNMIYDKTPYYLYTAGLRFSYFL